MKTFFDCETDVGTCPDEWLNGPSWSRSAEQDCRVLVQTVAFLNGTRRLLKMELRCFLRRGDEIIEQSWIKPEIYLESVLPSERQTRLMVKERHDQFAKRVRIYLAKAVAI